MACWRQHRSSNTSWGDSEVSSATPLSASLPRARMAELGSAQSMSSASRLLRFLWFTVRPMLTWRRGAHLAYTNNTREPRVRESKGLPAKALVIKLAEAFVYQELYFDIQRALSISISAAFSSPQRRPAVRAPPNGPCATLASSTKQPLAPTAPL